MVPKTSTDFSCLPSIYRNFTVFGLNGTVKDSRWSAELRTVKTGLGLGKVTQKNHQVPPDLLC